MERVTFGKMKKPAFIKITSGYLWLYRYPLKRGSLNSQECSEDEFHDTAEPDFLCRYQKYTTYESKRFYLCCVVQALESKNLVLQGHKIQPYS